MKNLLTIIILYLLLSMSQAWSLPPCEGHVWNNCIGTYTWEDGAKYVGEWKNNKKHGQGTYTSAEGEKYVGEYKNDKMHGQGTLTLAEGDKYVGGFKDDAMHGQGTITSVDGRILQGQFKDGEWINGKEYAAGEYNFSSDVSSLPTCKDSPQTEGLEHIFWDNCQGT